MWNGVELDYLGTDFDLRRLPLTRKLYQEPGGWQQIKGDPAIRGQVLAQTRVIGLELSCDRSHYLSYEEFLEEDSPIWQSVAT